MDVLLYMIIYCDHSHLPCYQIHPPVDNAADVYNCITVRSLQKIVPMHGNILLVSIAAVLGMAYCLTILKRTWSCYYG